ncbi:PAS domain S-box protein (macronuclear) [Tetrahymena thermophila SB210]|uniref:PAS domain S-box protein n=1 Tax=Tetrahymena thermophila (strain SB210) TaxID=312017 RepID=W7X3Y9_TETTS|nr:PAS domain S-box protein [Tetrahymena thermophila SB210]EWS74030.1 PAS domain S-box protein [Tetrahymena thermophila SB210]|eukprot:XP_012653429.1 PAS domain S-box protein [Tetrahymena thermophila SB210]
MILEYITIDHNTLCEEYPECFCSKEPLDVKQFQDMVLSKDLRQKYLIKYVRQMFGNFIQESLSKSKKIPNLLCFTYLNFLIEIYQNKLISFSEIIRLKKLMKLSFRETAIFVNIFQRAANLFKQAEQSNKLASKISQTQKKNQKQQEEQISLEDQYKRAIHDDKIEITDYMVGIKFDELLNKTEEKYYNTLQQKQQFLLLLFQDHVNLTMLRELALKIIQQKESLHLDLLTLNKINQNSQKLQFYIENFINYLGFGQKKRMVFKKNKQFNFDGLNTDANVFNRDTCVVFISLINDIGAIRKVQNKFENMFGYSCQESLKKNISIIIPKYLQRAHDEILKNYVRNPENSTINYFKLQIAQNEKGWAVPICLKFRPDYINLEDCGLTAFIQKIQNDYYYILMSCQRFQIQCLSQILFNKIFRKVFSQSEVHKIHLNRVIPLLNYLEKQQVNHKYLETVNQTVQTIAFIPKEQAIQKGLKRFSLTQKLDIQNLQKYVESLSVEFYDLYSVKLKFILNNFSKAQFNILELHTFKKITNYQSQKESLQNFKNQLHTLLNINIDITNDLEIIDQLIELQNLQNAQDSHESNLNISEEDNQSISVQENYADKYYRQNNNNNNNNYNQIFHHQSSFGQKEFVQNEINMNDGEASKMALVQESYLQGISYNQVTKLQEQSQEVEQKNYNELTNIYYPNLNYKVDNLDSFNTNNMNNYPQNLISPLSNNSLFTTLVSPHQPQSENKLLYKKQISDTSKVDQNYLNLSKLKDDSQLSKEQNIFTENLINNQNIQANNSFNTKNQINENNILNVKQQSRRSKLLHHQQSINNILNEYYDSKQLEAKNVPDNLSQARKDTQKGQKNLLNAQDNIVTQNKEIDTKEYDGEKSTDYQKSINQKSSYKASLNEESNNPKAFNFCQLLKERIKQAKLQLQQENQAKYFRKTSSKIQLNTQRQSFQDREQNLNTNSIQQANDKNGTLQFSLERYYNTTKFERNKSKKQTLNHGQTFFSHKQVLQAEEITSEQLSDSIAREEENQREFEMQKSRLNATSSINTSQSLNQEVKKNIFRMIHSVKRNNQLNILMVFGFAALFSFSALILYQYLQNDNQFNTAYLNFQYLPWPLSIRFLYSKIISDSYLKIMYDSNYFQSLEANPSYEQTLIDRQASTRLDYKNSLINFINADNVDQNYFLYTINNNMNVVISKDISVLKNPYLNITANKQQLKAPILYFIIFMNSYFQTNQNMVSNLFFQTISLDNFPSFNTQVTQIQTLISQSVTSITDSIQSQALFIMIFIIVVIILLGFLTIPLYYHIQVKNEELLKLFCTLSSQSLNDMVQPIQISILSHKTQTKIKYFQLPIYKKRKAISSYSEIKKFNIKHIFYIIIAILLMIIQPVISYVYIADFYNEANILIQLIQNFYNVKATCVSIQTISNAEFLISSKNSKLYNTIYFSQRLSLLSSQQSQSLNSFYSAIQLSQSSKRYQNQLYEDFFYKIITDDLCNTVQQYPQYVSSKNQFDISKCQQVRSGILSKGLQISIKEFFQVYFDISPLYNITDINQFTKLFYSWENSNNLIELDQFFDIITKSIEILKDFLLDRVNSFINEMKFIFKSLLIYQLIMMVFIFYFGFAQFYYQVKDEMIQTKRIISILSIESVLDNPYMLSYLNKQEN